MALSRVERIRQEREELIREMEGKNKSPRNFKKLLVALTAIAVTSTVVFFGVKLLINDKTDSKASITSTKKENKSKKLGIKFEDSYNEITAGDSFDLTSGVILTDDKDSEAKLRNSLEISSTPEFDANKEGSYTIVYKITDSDNHSVENTRNIVVKPAAKNEKPSILVENSYIEIEVGTAYDLKEGVSIINGDQSLLTQLKVNQTPTFNKNKVGEYNITYSVTDSAGNKLEATKKIVVKAKNSTNTTGTGSIGSTATKTNTSTDKEIPILKIDSQPITIKIGQKVDLISYVLKITDNIDTEQVLKEKLKIISEPYFNPFKAGEYHLTYITRDSAGNVSQKFNKVITVVE